MHYTQADPIYQHDRCNRFLYERIGIAESIQLEVLIRARMCGIGGDGYSVLIASCLAAPMLLCRRQEGFIQDIYSPIITPYWLLCSKERTMLVQSQLAHHIIFFFVSFPSSSPIHTFLHKPATDDFPWSNSAVVDTQKTFLELFRGL